MSQIQTFQQQVLNPIAGCVIVVAFAALAVLAVVYLAKALFRRD